MHVQLDVFGGSVEVAPAPVEGAGEPLELFEPAAFSARVPGTLPMDMDASAGEPENAGGAAMRDIRP